MNRYLIGGSLATLILVGIGIYFIVKQDTIVSKDLSDRAREFVKEQESKEDSTWSRINFEPKKASAQALSSFTLEVKGCFSIIIPFAIKEVRSTGDCAKEILINSPYGEVVVYQKSIDSNGLDALGDIKLRRLQSERYEESHVKLGEIEYLVFNNKQEKYQQSAFYLHNRKLFILNLNVNSNENLDPEFLQMLQTVKFL